MSVIHIPYKRIKSIVLDRHYSHLQGGSKLFRVTKDTGVALYGDFWAMGDELFGFNEVKGDGFVEGEDAGFL